MNTRKYHSSGNRCLTINESRTMKKIYSFMVAAVALFAAASCNKELPQENLPTVGETVVYTASTDGADTKAVLNETTKKSEWVENDAITVHDGEKGWTFTTAEAGANVDFSNSEGFGEYRPVLAVYPAGTYTVDVNDKTVNAYIPTYQPARKGTYNEGAALAVAYSENDQFAFKNAHALIKFTIKGTNIKAVEFYGNNNEAITGNMLVSLNEDNTIKSVVGQDTVFEEGKDNEWTGKGTWVKIYSEDEANGWCFEDGATYYAAVAPTDFTKGVSINYILADDTKIDGAKKTENRVNLTASTILNIGELEFTGTIEPEEPAAEWAIAGTFNEWNTTADPMTLENGFYVARNVTGLNFTAQADASNETSATGFQFINKGDWKGGEGKVTAGTWAYVWNNNGQNIYVNEAAAETAYDIYLNPTPDASGGIKFVIVAAGAAMPEDKPAEEVKVEYWAVVGSMTDNWGSEKEMTLEGDWYVVNNVKITTSDEFKFRADGKWEDTPNRGATGDKDGVIIANNTETDVVNNGKNFSVAESGFYSLYLNKAANKAKVVKTADLPVEVTPDQPSEWALVGAFTKGDSNWKEIRMVTTSTPDLFVAKSVVVPVDYTSMLIKKFGDANWSVKYGGGIVYFNPGNWMALSSGGSDISITKAGTYDFYFDLAGKKLYVVAVGADYKSVPQQTKEGEEPKQEEPEVTSNVLYLKPNSNWIKDNARFAAYFFIKDTDKNAWVSMTDSDEDGYYEVNIPEGYTFGDYVIFCRMNPNTTANNWDNKWNQTSDLKVPTDGTNLYTVKDDTWDKGGGTWSVK